jgi:hypothetical protein
LATIAVFPYTMEINASLLEQVPLSLAELVLLQSLQIAIMLLIGNYAGLRLGDSVGLYSPIARVFIYRLPLPKLSLKIIATTIVTGFTAGLIIIGLDFMFQPFLPTANQGDVPSIARWKGFMASFYGGITEELLLRLFLMTLITWIIWKIFMRGKGVPKSAIYWVAIILAAIFFGVGHLPAASLIWPLTPIVILRIILLNAIPGMAFGYLFWKQGLEYAMLAHFCADIVLHVIMGG